MSNTTHLWVFGEGVKIPFGMEPLPAGMKLVGIADGEHRAVWESGVS
jgi:hypothetical protein